MPLSTSRSHGIIERISYRRVKMKMWFLGKVSATFTQFVIFLPSFGAPKPTGDLLHARRPYLWDWVQVG